MSGKTLGTILFILTLAFLIVSGVSPHERFTWWLEVSWVILGLVVVIVVAARGTGVSTSLKLALFVHALILIYGGWHTYAEVPLGEWMREAFGFERNHYDRIGHFAQGLFPAILFREVLYRNAAARGRVWREVFVFALCMAFTGLFEILEFASAVAFGEASAAYLGSQGDVWDAQWDMIFCGLGALAAIFLWAPLHLRELKARFGERATRAPDDLDKPVQ